MNPKIRTFGILLISVTLFYLVSCEKKQSLPVVGETRISNITKISAEATGYILTDGGGTIDSRGFCWDTVDSPTRLNNCIIVEGDIGAFSGKLMLLKPGKLYYVRGFATNKAGTEYGSVTQFTTTEIKIPSVGTRVVHDITHRSAYSGVYVINDGGGQVMEKGVCWGTAPNPGLSDNKTNEGPGNAMLYSFLTNLMPSTTYYVRAYATNSAGTAFGDQLSFETYHDSLVDIDNNIYYSILFGNQEWMGSNLKVTRYGNGDLIGTTSPVTLDIRSETNPEYQWVYNGDENAVINYDGRLYSWYAATDSRKLCPEGWHLPGDEEWTVLINYLGGEAVAGGKMKTVHHWMNPNTGATNESGFGAIPAGTRDPDGTFQAQDFIARWWSSTSYSTTEAYNRYCDYLTQHVIKSVNSGSSGYSVRCIKN